MDRKAVLTKHKKIRNRITDYIHSAGLAEISEQIQALGKPSVIISTIETTDQPQAGESRMGGCPNLPAELTWPTYKKTPMVFLAQFNLTDISPFDIDGSLPSDGLLSFFLHAVLEEDGTNDDYGHQCKVIYTAQDDINKLISRPLPDHEGLIMFSPQQQATVHFEADIALPPPGSDAIDSLSCNENAEIIIEAYWDKVWLKKVDEREDTHRLLGYPDVDTGEEQGASKLLFQISFDELIDWSFGDAQSVRFYMPSGALEQQAWEQAWSSGDEH